MFQPPTSLNNLTGIETPRQAQEAEMLIDAAGSLPIGKHQRRFYSRPTLSQRYEKELAAIARRSHTLDQDQPHLVPMGLDIQPGLSRTNPTPPPPCILEKPFPPGGHPD